MQPARSRIDIKRPPGDIYAFVSDFARHGEFAGHRLRIEHVEGPASAAGGRYRSHGNQLGREIIDELTILEAQPPSRFVFESRGRGGAFRHEYIIEATAGGSRLTRTMAFVEAALPVRLLTPLFNVMIARRNQGDMQRLKQLLEN